MLIRARGIAVKPFLWKFQRKWLYGVDVECDVTPEEYEAMKLDPRISASPVVEIKVDRVFVEEEEPRTEIKRRGRPRKNAEV